MNSVESKPYLTPLFEIGLPKLCDNLLGFILGVLLGFYTKFIRSERLKLTAKNLKKITDKFLQKIFIPFIPLLIIGFVLKMQHEGTFLTLLKSFLPLLIIIISTQALYIFLAYLLVNNLNFIKTFSAIKNILPAAFVGFSTMSSAVAMPVLITGAMKNAKNKTLTQSIIPPIINIHMLGDSLAIPLMAISLYMMDYGHIPILNHYIRFALGYVIAKFSATGVPGGTILIMIPVLESKLGFDSEMSSVILMIYMLFDPFCTMANIFGNGALAITFEKFKNKIRFLRPSLDPPQ